MKKIIFSIFIVLLVFGYLTYRQSNSRSSVVNPPIAAVEEAPLPSPSPEIPSQISPDGKYTVSVHQEGIFVNDESKFANTKYPAGELLTQFNSWSPNNKYFYLLRKVEKEREYLVFRADGTPISKDETYYNVNQYFINAFPELKLIEVTGWASPLLIVVNADDSSGNSMSYWFDLTTRHFIRLSNYFE